MYKVTATVSHPQAENAIVLNGLFVPKGSNTSMKKLERQVSSFIRTKLKVKNSPDVTPDDLTIKIVAEPIKFDFQVVEDKQ